MYDPDLLNKVIDRLTRPNSIILLHHNADPDAVGSAISLKLAYGIQNICAAESVSTPGKRLAGLLNEEILISPDITNYENHIVLDCSTPVQLGDLARDLKEPLVIDHHTSSDDWKSDTQLQDPEASSCAEIIYEILKYGGKDITADIGLCLLSGIITDTGRFRFANERTFVTVSKLLNKSGQNMEDVLSSMEDEDYFNFSKRMAQLKAASRMDIIPFGEYLVAYSQVSSYEAAAARALMLAGADVVFVSNGKSKDLRISSRAKPQILKMGLNLGDFMSIVAGKAGCQGGGHPGAAGLNGKGDPENAKKIIIDEIKEFFKTIEKKEPNEKS